MKIFGQMSPVKDHAFDAVLMVLKDQEKTIQSFKNWFNSDAYHSLDQSLKKRNGSIEPYQMVSAGIPSCAPASYAVITRIKSDGVLEQIRKAAGEFYQYSQKERLKKLAIILDPFLDEKHTVEDVVQAFAEGVSLGSFTDSRYRSIKKESPAVIVEITLLYSPKKYKQKIDAAIKEVQIIREAVFHTQTLVNAPSNYLTPKLMAKDAVEMAQKYHIRSKAYGRTALEKMKMGGILAVARGSAEEPRLIVLDYGRRTGPVDFCIVGKGITFDSGGISIKPSEGMDRMKYDMSGGAVVIGVLEAVSRLKLPLRVVGLVAASENMPSGTATKPGDIIRMASGKYVEVLNTDAEGRLVLADALYYAKRYKPRAVIDLATLTGACIVALGHHASAIMGNDSALLNDLRTAADQTGESVWELPLWDVYEEQIKSDLADIKNVAKGGAGTITAGMFLKQFVDFPWAHLDIAGVAWHETAHSYCPKGPTGFGVRLLVRMMKNYCLQRKS